MIQVACVHSFRGGTGKSTLTASLAGQLAQRGRAVGVVDTDLASPGIHVLFGLDGAAVEASLNDYLFGRRTMGEVARPVVVDGPGSIHLVPASVRAGEITRILREGYDAQRLVRGLREVVDALSLDVLLVDTHPGLGEETLLSLAISDTVVTVLRPDRQDYEGTAVLQEVAAGLGVRRQGLVVSKVPPGLDPAGVRSRVETAYGCPVVGVVRHDDDLMALASAGIFTLQHPDHPVTAAVSEVADWLEADR
ncbi:MinD/ParA family protein [Ornithinimicrobium sp. F0845]|uniref:MinD/ParA family ATP-binding protein n=1 Tax=Ornithinimicrobium sp. F0845 TaxID=2926412 RepID=UPI001FF38B0A|nr:MinD/ParA family protein [Ornithinimicrobium sp. F0845]MCK0112376.1 MinD/ParA family protein [Ornithinimicrobium sp. F0845]